MKRLLLITIATLFISATFVKPTLAQEFEGIIHYEMDKTNQASGTHSFKYMVKGNKARAEFGEGKQKGSMILMPEESKMIVVVEAIKGYMTTDYSSAKYAGEDADTELTKTGKTKQIAGKECEVWKVGSLENSMESCLAKEMGTFAMPQSPNQQRNQPDWLKEFVEVGGMPLEIVAVEDGDRSHFMKAVKIEEKSLSSDLFEVPEGYRDVSGMMKQGMQNRN